MNSYFYGGSLDNLVLCSMVPETTRAQPRRRSGCTYCGAPPNGKRCPFCGTIAEDEDDR